MNIVKKIDNYFFNYFDEYYYNFLEKHILDNCKTVCDLGCGKNSPIKYFKDKINFSLGVDCFESYIDESKNNEIHNQYINSDIIEACKKIDDKSFDCVIALDVIEHYTKENGYFFMKEMERIAKNKIILFTPNGYLDQEIYDGNDHQKHLSGWSPDEFKDLGFKVYGMSGLKAIRGERGYIKYRPRYLWRRISFLTQPFVKYFSSLAFQIICIKEINE